MSLAKEVLKASICSVVKFSGEVTLSFLTNSSNWSMSFEYARMVAVERPLVFKSATNWALKVWRSSGLLFINYEAEVAYNNSGRD